jgi:hypothetical protein
MGFAPPHLPYLALAEKRGLGVAYPHVIWIGGNDIDEARHLFTEPTGFSG